MTDSTSILKPGPLAGAISGDVIGSKFEGAYIKTTEFPILDEDSDFTDDTVLTVAVADSLTSNKPFTDTLWEYGRRHPDRGYGGMFISWLQEERPKPYGSYGNGSAMRVSPVGAACQTMEEVLEIAERSAEVTHNHPEGIKGAKAIAAAVFLAQNGSSKADIRNFIVRSFNYNLDFRLDDIRAGYEFNATCQRTVPEAIVAFLESDDYESAVRLAVSIGGDTDTIACMTGGTAGPVRRS